jgi:predicted Rossmann-fold nucleotide-binding protein
MVGGRVDVTTTPLRVLPAAGQKSLTICIYCGAAVGHRRIFEEQTRAAARVIVSEGHRIIYGAAKNGLMGVMADEALKCGGNEVGVIPALLVDKELLHKALSVRPKTS